MSWPSARYLRSILGVGERLGDCRTREPVEEFEELATNENHATVELAIGQQAPRDAPAGRLLGDPQEPGAASDVERLAVYAARTSFWACLLLRRFGAHQPTTRRTTSSSCSITSRMR